MANMKVLAKNHWGGKLIRVKVPMHVYEESREIQEAVRKGEIQREGIARDRWMSKIMPHIRKALGDYELDPIRDQVWIRPMASRSKIVKVKRNTKIHAPDSQEVLKVFEPMLKPRGKG